MEEQIIKSLIELYREQGIDVAALVGDPVFTSLPVATRIDMIKKYADDLAHDINPNLHKSDIKRMIRESAIGAALGGGGALIGAMRATNFMNEPDWKGTLKPAARVAAIGAGFGLATSGIRTMAAIRSRKELHSQALELAKDPSDKNAIKLMSLRAMQPVSLKGTDPLTYAHGRVENKYIDHILRSQDEGAYNVFNRDPDAKFDPNQFDQAEAYERKVKAKMGNNN